MTPVLYALTANICFSIAILIYTSFSLKTSVIWTNTFKAIVAFLAFVLSVTAILGWNPVLWPSIFAFFISGAIGLAIGDLFLLRAFTLIGPSRSMVLFGFQPLFMGVTSWWLFSQEMPLHRLLAVVFLIACLVIFSMERYKAHREWGIKGILLALTAVLLDGAGILLTRYGFDTSPEIHAFEGNAYRCAGAVAGLFVIGWARTPIHLVKHFMDLTVKTRVLIVFASLLGTFFSLGFYLQAVKTGHLASISAVAITGPFFAALFEYLYKKQWPGRHFVLAFVMFAIGFWLMNW